VSKVSEGPDIKPSLPGTLVKEPSNSKNSKKNFSSSTSGELSSANRNDAPSKETDCKPAPTKAELEHSLSMITTEWKLTEEALPRYLKLVVAAERKCDRAKATNETMILKEESLRTEKEELEARLRDLA
jgi:hypothetical protein